MKNIELSGTIPTLITPFQSNMEIDFRNLECFLEWLVRSQVRGVFAVCQSSEMFFLSLRERLLLARKVCEIIKGRVPVLGSGHVSAGLEDQKYELEAMADTGIDALVLVVNRIPGSDGDEDLFRRSFLDLLSIIPDKVEIGLYECPYPEHLTLSLSMIKWLATETRTTFLKDTSSNPAVQKARANFTTGTRLKLFNANSASLLDSLDNGYTGFSGVMGNIQPLLYQRLCEWKEGLSQETAEELSMFLGVTSLFERQLYPANAKYYLSLAGIPMETVCRSIDYKRFTPSMALETEQLFQMSRRMEEQNRSFVDDLHE